MKQRIIFLCLGLFAAAAILSACGSVASQSAQNNIEISNMLKTNWQNYAAGWPGFGGSLSLYIISPRGNFFATSSTGLGENTHFRCASVTKTFTAAAIILLNQQGKLDINDLITANIPGSGELYLFDKNLLLRVLRIWEAVLYVKGRYCDNILC